MILFILQVSKTHPSLRDLLILCNSGLHCTYCIWIKNIYVTTVVINHNLCRFFVIFTQLVKIFKIVTITGNPWGSKSIIHLYFASLSGQISFTKEVLFITSYRFGLPLSANKSKTRTLHPTPHVLYLYFLRRTLSNFTSHIFVI